MSGDCTRERETRRNRIPSLTIGVISSVPNLIRLLSGLAWIYLTLGYRVRRARRAFESQLIEQGMSISDARRLGARYDELKDDIVLGLKQGMFVTPQAINQV